MLHAASGAELSSLSSRRFLWVKGVYAAFGLVILAVILIAAWAVHVDFDETRKGLLQAEVNRLRSHALRTVLRLQESLRTVPQLKSLDELKPAKWLEEHWQTFLGNDASRVYAAVVDSNRKIVLHSNKLSEGLTIGDPWYISIVPDVGEDVVETTEPVLSGGVQAYDISLPITYGADEIGTYHSGLRVAWFDHLVESRRAVSRRRWAIAFVFMSAVISFAGLSLFHVSRRISVLHSALALGHIRRLADLGQLAGGIAHEVRNPLQAIRFNLHALHQLLIAENYDEQRDGVILRETTYEIERIDDLLRSLLDYSRPDKMRREQVDLASEVAAVCDLLQTAVQRDNICLNVEVPENGCLAYIDRSRFRQIILNLLKNAIEAVGKDGNVTAGLRAAETGITLTVCDDGDGIDPRIVERIFDPFFTTKELGTGLGLTLIRRAVEDEGGSVSCAAVPNGTVFTVWIPRRTTEQI